MSKILNIMIFICFIVIAYIIIRFFEAKASKEIKEARGEGKYLSSNAFKEFKYKIEKVENIKEFQTLFEKTRARLNRYGNYYNFVTPVSYYLIKILAISLQILLLIVSKKINWTTFALPLIVFFFVDIFYFLKNIDDNGEIRNDLPKVYNVLEINAYAGVGIETSIALLPEIVKNKRFKEQLIKLSAEILVKKQIGEALNNFKNSFTLLEIESLCLGLNQSFESGKNIEFLINQREILEKGNLNRKDVQTKKADSRFFISMMLILSGIMGVVIFSFYTQIFQNLTKLFG